MPQWFYADQPADARVASAGGPEHRGIGLVLPVRMSDCSGARPSWWPFENNVCNVDAAEPVALTARERSI